MDRESVEKRPAICVVGSPNFGKRTLLSRLLKVDFDDASDTSPELSVHEWTIDTKYYTADVAVWTTHLSNELSIASLLDVDRMVALVMVFDTSEPLSLVALKEWVLRTDIQKFDILLCIGNKVDLLPGHPAHVEYKRRLMKLGESSGTSHLDFSDYGLSADGDPQGVERLYGAISAHMWPGMLLKSGDKIDEPSLPDQEELSEEESSDYEPEYEILSAASAEPWDDIRWMSADDHVPTIGSGRPMEKDLDTSGRESEVKSIEEENKPSISASQFPKELDREEAAMTYEADPTSEVDVDKTYEIEDLEILMAEIGNMLNGLRLMPDFQRMEMAAKLAMKMAAMFEDSSGGEEEEEELIE